MFNINAGLILKLMEERKLKYHTLAQLSKCKPDTIRHAVQYKRARPITIAKIANGLGIDPDSLLVPNER